MQSERPVIDYANLPYLAREGIQSLGNNRYITRALFLETAPDEEAEKSALWCLSEHEILAHGRWYPSAWMAYIHATDEYDALRKICGNVRQWEHICKMLEKTGRATILESWRAEQAHLQRSHLKSTLMGIAGSGGPGNTAAARMLLQMIDGPVKRGRPKKEAAPAQPDPGVAEDMGRVLKFQR